MVELEKEYLLLSDHSAKKKKNSFSLYGKNLHLPHQSISKTKKPHRNIKFSHNEPCDLTLQLNLFPLILTGDGEQLATIRLFPTRQQTENNDTVLHVYCAE